MDLIFLSKIFEDSYSKKLIKAKDLNFSFVRFEEAKSNFYLDYNEDVAVWWSKNIENYSQIDSQTSYAMNTTLNFMVSLYKTLKVMLNAETNEDSVVLGFNLNSGLQVRYPETNLSENLPCLINQTLSDIGLGINITYGCGAFAVSLGFSQGTFTSYLKSSLVNSLLLDDITKEIEDKYILVVAPIGLSYVIALSGQTDVENIVCGEVFKDDFLLNSLCEEIQLVGLETTRNITLKGYNSYVFASFSNVNINASIANYFVSDNTSFISGVFIYKQLVLQDWNSLISDIISIIVTQLGIFIIFIILTITIAWSLSGVITNKIIKPIEIIERMLQDKSTEEETKGKYNKEVNEVINSLKLLNTLKKFIDPHFLLNPEFAKRRENLNEAFHMFDGLNNNRGRAIVKNLIGNTFYLEKNFQMAEENYDLALKCTVELEADLLQQNEKELKLDMFEKEELRHAVKKKYVGWSKEIQFIAENIIERKQQMCIALEAQAEIEGKRNRNLLKRINLLQLTILEYYVSTRTHYIRMIKVLLDMAKNYQYLQFYHSGLQLLDVVKDELIKLRNDGVRSVDIDLTRLKSIGIDLIKNDAAGITKHFALLDVVYEKDILMQEMYYRRGSILHESSRFQEAGNAFISAIVKSYLGTWEIFRPAYQGKLGKMPAKADEGI